MMHGNRPSPVQSTSAITEVLVTTTLIQVMATATMLALAPIAAHAASDFGVSPHAIGYQISLIYLFGAAGSAFTGSLVARLGPVRVEQLALVLFAAGLLALATAHLLAGALGSALIGVGYGLQNPASSQILSRIAPAHRRNMIFSIKQAGVPVGGALASIGFPLLDKATGWQTGFALLAIAPIGLCLLLERHARDHAPGAETTVATNWLRSALAGQKMALRGPFLPLSLLSLLYSSVQLTVSAFVVLMLVEDRGWSLAAAAATAALVQVAGACGRVLWGILGDRLRHGMIVLAAIGAICTLALLALWATPAMPAPLLVAVLCTLGATASGWNGVAMAEMARHCAPHEAGSVIGAILVYTFIGVVVGPSAFSALYGHIGAYGHTFALFGLASGIGCVLAFAAAVRQRPRPS